MIYLRTSVALAASALFAFLIIADLPFTTLPPYGAEIICVFRIVSAVLLINRYMRWMPVARLLWGSDRYRTYRTLLKIGMVLSFLMGIGFATPVVVVLNFLLLMFLTRQGGSRLYGLEDIYFNFSGFSLVLMIPVAPWSVDAIVFGGTFLVPGNHLIGVNFLVCGISLILLSAGMWKLSTKTWRDGLGVFKFLGLPHLSRPFAKPLLHMKRPMMSLNYVEIAAQILPLFVIVVPYLREGVFFYNIAFGLALVTVFSFGMLAFQYIALITASGALLHAGSVANGFQMSAIVFPDIASMDPQILALKVFLCFVFLSSAIGSIVGATPANPVLLSLSKPFAKVSRYSTGIIPVSVFNDRHLEGLYVYRLVGTHAGQQGQVFPFFVKDGRAGPFSVFSSIIFLDLMYKITDACLHAGRSDSPSSPFDPAIEDLCKSAMDTLPPPANGNVSTVTLEVKPIPRIPSRTVANEIPDLYAEREWMTIAQLQRNAQGDDTFDNWINVPNMLTYSARMQS